MIKGPVLVRLDFRAGSARRFVRKFRQSFVSGLPGWKLEQTHEAKFNPAEELPLVAVELFRVTGGG